MWCEQPVQQNPYRIAGMSGGGPYGIGYVSSCCREVMSAVATPMVFCEASPVRAGTKSDRRRHVYAGSLGCR